MKFSAQEEVAVPAGNLFDMLCDFESLEDAAHRRGVDVVRTDATDGRLTGTAWQADVRLQGKPLRVDIVLLNLQRPEQIELGMTGPGLEGGLTVALTGLAPQCTRLTVSAELRPHTLTARLLVKSLKFTQTTLDRKFEARVAEYLQRLESRYAASRDD